MVYPMRDATDVKNKNTNDFFETAAQIFRDIRNDKRNRYLTEEGKCYIVKKPNLIIFEFDR